MGWLGEYGLPERCPEGGGVLLAEAGCHAGDDFEVSLKCGCGRDREFGESAGEGAGAGVVAAVPPLLAADGGQARRTGFRV